MDLRLLCVGCFSTIDQVTGGEGESRGRHGEEASVAAAAGRIGHRDPPGCQLGWVSSLDLDDRIGPRRVIRWDLHGKTVLSLVYCSVSILFPSLFCFLTCG